MAPSQTDGANGGRKRKRGEMKIYLNYSLLRQFNFTAYEILSKYIG